MKVFLTIGVVLSLTASKANAVFIADFPGLDELIEQADAIVVVHIDQTQRPAMRPYGSYRCRIQKTLKGNVPSGKHVILSLMDARSLFSRSDVDYSVKIPAGWSNPFPHGSSHLLFLTCGSESNDQPKYQSIACLGSTIRLSSSNDDNFPAQSSTREQIKALLQRTAELKARQLEKDQRFLELVIDNHASTAVERK